MQHSTTEDESFFDRMRRAVQEGRSGAWVERLTRFGYATRGVVFSLIGLLAARAAVGLGRAAGTQEAIETLSVQPFGRILAGLTALGLISYVLWRFVQAALDPVHTSTGFRSVMRRAGFFGSGVFYAVLAFFAAQLALGLPVTGEEARIEWTRWALAIPYGKVIVGVIGVVILFVGFHAFYRSILSTFMNLYPEKHKRGTRGLLIKLFGQVGLASLGFTLCIMGSFVFLAAVYSDPYAAIGIAGALEVLGAGPYGPMLLATMAFGFLLYGLHCFALARYRKVKPYP